MSGPVSRGDSSTPRGGSAAGGGRAAQGAAEGHGALGPRTGISLCLARLDEALDAAATLGGDTSAATNVRDTARQRLGFPSAVYVLALAGGTGVGKSSLLNALAGERISAAGARRPTTAEPVAWFPVSARHDVTPLLDWLGVDQRREHDATGPVGLAVLDLPDLDSITPEHRARVDELLPRIDAVVWIADPEKYGDALLHHAYLARWGPRLARQAVVINKTDRLDPADAERLRGDLTRRLRLEDLPEVPVLLASSIDGRKGLGELEQWLESGVEAKQVVLDRLGAEARVVIAELAARAGVDPSRGSAPVVSAERRARTLADVERAALGIVDMTGLERQAMAATRQAARPRGGGPLGLLTGRLYRWSGRESAAADPSGYLRRWRERGSLTRALVPIREMVTEALPSLPPTARPAVVAVAEPGPLQARLGEAIDRAVAGHAGTFRTPTSIVWPVLGVAQYAVTAGLLLGAVWLLALWLGPNTPVSTVEVGPLGLVPVPALLIAGGLIAGFVLGRVLALHAAWVGRRWAARLRSAIGREIETRVSVVFTPLDELDAARARLYAASEAAQRDCGR